MPATRLAALIAGGAAWLFGPAVVFYLLAAMSLASVVSVLAIPEAAIDHDLARGLHDTAPGEAKRAQPSGFSVLLTCRPLLIFALCAMCFICRMRRCCRWSEKSSRCRTGISAPA